MLHYILFLVTHKSSSADFKLLAYDNMVFYLSLFFLILITILLILFFHSRRKTVPDILYEEGVKAENLGNFKEAVLKYEKALSVVDNFRFRRDLKIKILNRIKVLRTVIKYENTFTLKSQ